MRMSIYRANAFIISIPEKITYAAFDFYTGTKTVGRIQKVMQNPYSCIVNHIIPE